ncbi:hypothetical protein ABXN37_29275, partial [Piscinibacter sakaiensis]
GRAADPVERGILKRLMNRLATFTEDQLLEELIRRRNQRTTAHPEHWCHDCQHYKAWDEVERPRDAIGRIPRCPDDFNPCTKGHKMQFVVPEDYPDGQEWGYYRKVCADRLPVDGGAA